MDGMGLAHALHHVVHHDDRHDDADRHPYGDDVRHRKPTKETQKATLLPDFHLSGRLPVRLGRLQPGCGGRSMALTWRRTAKSDDVQPQLFIERRHPGRGRHIPVDADERRLSPPVPHASRVLNVGLAKRALGGVQDGNAPRPVLCRLLLGVDGDLIFGRRNEHALGGADNDIRIAGKNTAPAAEMDACDDRPGTDLVGGLVAKPLPYRRRLISCP